MTIIDALDALPWQWAMPILALFGLIVGSYIATLVLRWGAGESVLGRSHCDGCQRTLRWAELVPLVGWLRARGRCKDCGGAINPLHLRTELAAAAIGAMSIAMLPGAGGWLLAIFGWLLLPLALLDARHFWLPDALVAPLAVVGLLLAGPLLETVMIDRVIGAAAGGIVLGLLRAAFKHLRGRDGMGEGDPKFAAAIGAWLGWQLLPVLFLLASVGGIIWALASHKKDAPIADQHVPFGSFMAAAAWIAVPLWGYIIV